VKLILDKLKKLFGKKDIYITKDMDVFTINEDSELESTDEHIIKNYTQKKVEKDMAENIKKPDQENTKETKEDLVPIVGKEKMVPENSTLAEENRISNCMKETGKSREECSKKVKGQMKKEGNQAVTAAQDTEDVEKVEICPKELDMLKEKAKKLDAIEEENKTLKSDMAKYTEILEVIKKEREDEKESKRQEKIKQINKDFYIPIEEIQDFTMEELERSEKLLGIAGTIKSKESEDIEEDFTPSDVAESLMKQYRHPLLKGDG